MDPHFLLEAIAFRATSGNHLIRVVDLGENGISPHWIRRPTAEDMNEFVLWARTKLPAGAEVTNDMGVTLQKAREHYAFWKKKLEGI